MEARPEDSVRNEIERMGNNVYIAVSHCYDLLIDSVDPSQTDNDIRNQVLRALDRAQANFYKKKTDHSNQSSRRSSSQTLVSDNLQIDWKGADPVVEPREITSPPTSPSDPVSPLEQWVTSHQVRQRTGQVMRPVLLHTLQDAQTLSSEAMSPTADPVTRVDEQSQNQRMQYAITEAEQNENQSQPNTPSSGQNATDSIVPEPEPDSPLRAIRGMTRGEFFNLTCRPNHQPIFKLAIPNAATSDHPQTLEVTRSSKSEATTGSGAEHPQDGQAGWSQQSPRQASHDLPVESGSGASRGPVTEVMDPCDSPTTPVELHANTTEILSNSNSVRPLRRTCRSQPVTPASAQTSTPTTGEMLPLRRRKAQDKEDTRRTSAVTNTSQTKTTPSKPAKCTPPKASTVILPRPMLDDKLSTAAKEANVQAKGTELCAKQWSHYRKNKVMPLTLHQWEHLSHVLREMSEELQAKGAVVLQPDWPEVTEASATETTQSPLELSFGRLGIESKGLVPGKWCVIDAKRADVPQRVSLATTSDEVDAVLKFDELEAIIQQDVSTTSLYARDIDGEDFDNCMALYNENSRLRQLDGDFLSNLDGDIAGVSTPYLYVGTRGSTFNMHVEDEELMSLNRLIAGQKQWIVVPRSHREAFERILRQVFHAQTPASTPPTCHQFGRHARAFFFRSFLKDSNITFTKVTQNPGQVVVTAVGAYHQGYNATNNIAEAVNYAPDDWHPIEYNFCDPSCSIYYGEARVSDSWAALAVSAKIKDGRDISRTAGETISMTMWAKVTHEMASAVKIGTKHRKTAAGTSQLNRFIGGRTARLFSNLMLSLAPTQHMADLQRGLESTVTSPQGLSSLKRGCCELDMLRYGRFVSLIGEIIWRIGCLRVYRAIQDRYQQHRRLRSHGGQQQPSGGPRKRKSTSTAANSPEDDDSDADPQPSCQNGNKKQIIADFAEKNLRTGGMIDENAIQAAMMDATREVEEANRYGRFLHHLADGTGGDAIILSIPHKQIDHYVTTIGLNHQTFTAHLKMLRPQLVTSGLSQGSDDLGGMYARLVGALNLSPV